MADNVIQESIKRAFIETRLEAENLITVHIEEIERFGAALRKNFPEYSDEEFEELQKEVWNKLREEINFHI